MHTGILVASLVALGFSAAGVAESGNQPTVSPGGAIVAGLPNAMPIAFTENAGQWSKDVLFRSVGSRYVLWISRDGLYYQFSKQFGQDSTSLPKTVTIKVTFLGANRNVQVTAEGQLSFMSNYFLGNDPSRWYRDVPSYQTVTLGDLYPGVTVSFRGMDGRVAVEPSAISPANLKNVRLVYTGGASVFSRDDGTTVIGTEIGEVRFRGMAPDSEGLTGDELPGVLSEPATPLGLVYSTYLGGGIWDEARGIAMDASGCAYVVGRTSSLNFPVMDYYQKSQGAFDAFVSKLSADGTKLLYSTYLGGTSDDRARAVAVDKSGCAYVTGETSSSNFPLWNPYQTDQGSTDAFLVKLSDAGNALIYGSYLGGADGDYAAGIAVDGSGCAYITGYTQSTDLPTKNAFQTNQMDDDAFVTKFSATGNSLVYSTYLGGESEDHASAIAVDHTGCAYVTGYTLSAGYPLERHFQTNKNSDDAFVTKVSTGGNSLIYSTYLGGAQYDRGTSIAVDALGCAYVTGVTGSTDFPMMNPYQPELSGGTSVDVFVTKFNVAGDALVYSTYLGGSSSEEPRSIAVDNTSSAYVAGYTNSTYYPLQNPYQVDQAAEDAFVTKLSSAGNELVYSSYLGGAASDFGNAIAVDASGSAYVAGYTTSFNYPTRNPYQTDQPDADAFVTKLQARCCSNTTGNVNMTGIVDLSDLSLLIAYLTATPRPTLACSEEANINAIGIIDLSDLSMLIAYLTAAPRPTLPSCP